MNTAKRGFSLFLAFLITLSLAACAPQEPLPTMEQTAQALLSTTPQPAFGSVGGEWMILGLSRGEISVSQEILDQYYASVEAQVIACSGVLHERKYTEYSRVILALTAMGKDPTNVGGYNLLTPLADFEQTIFQGLNGPIYALLALDSGNYTIPQGTSGTQATREMYVQYILDQELPDGGWSLAGGEAEMDITAMALQALAKYRSRQDVAVAINRALTLLSQQQNSRGGYTAYGADSSETVSQVIVALTELGISIDDSRFVKTGRTLRDRLLDYQDDDGWFRHLPDGKTDAIATEQAFYALVALYRAENGMTSLYTMNR